MAERLLKRAEWRRSITTMASGREKPTVAWTPWAVGYTQVDPTLIGRRPKLQAPDLCITDSPLGRELRGIYTGPPGLVVTHIFTCLQRVASLCFF